MNNSKYLQDLLDLKNSLEKSQELSEKIFGPSDLSPTTDTIHTMVQELRQDIKDLMNYEHSLMVAEDQEDYK